MSGSKIRLYGSTSGYVELEAPAVGDDGVLVLPTAADGFGAAGIGSNVVQTFFNTTFTTTSTSFVDVTGFTATITPTSNTSKVLVLVQFAAVNTGASNDEFVLTRASTDIALANALTYSVKQNYENISTGNDYTIPAVINYLDSPATTSATAYKIRARRQLAGTLRVGGSSNANQQVASITLIEVAA